MSESTSQATCDAAAYAVEYLGATGVQLVPTDKDLMVQYLLRKLRGEPLPTDLVLDGRYAYAEHPEKLVSKLGEDIEGAWYLFSPRERRHAGGMKANRETGDGAGYWKAMGKEKRILADGTEVVGTKRELWYYEHIFEEDDMGMRKPVWTRYNATKWRMMEFVASNTNRPRGDDTAPDPMLLNDCVLCKIIRRPLKVKKNTGPAPAQGDEEEDNDDDYNGEEEPTSDGELQENKHLSEQQPTCGGSTGAQCEQPEGARGYQQQRPTLLDGAGSHVSQQRPTTAEALLLDDYYPGLYVGDADDLNRCDDLVIRSIFDFDHHIGTRAYVGGETLYAQQPAGGGGDAGAQGDQLRPLPFVGAGSHGNQQPATSGASGGLFVGLDVSNWFDTIMPSIFDSGDHIGTGTAYAGAQGDQLRPLPFVGAGSHANQQPATAGASDGLFVGLDGSNWFDTITPSIFGFDDHIGTGTAYGSGGETQGEQQPAGSGSTGAQGDGQPETAGAALLDDFFSGELFAGLDGSNRPGTIMPSIFEFDFDDHIGTAYGGDETMDAQRAWYQQAESSGGGAGSSPDKQQQQTPPGEQQQPTPEVPNEEEGAAASAAASQHDVS